MPNQSEIEYLWEEYKRQNERIKELEDELLNLEKACLQSIETLKYYIDGGFLCLEKNCKKRMKGK